MKQFEMDGWVCGEITTRSTNSGKQVTSFSVNSPDRRKNQQTGEWESVPQFFPCQYWHKSDRDYSADAIYDGNHLVLFGNPRFEQWEHDGSKRSKVSFNVNKLFSIARNDAARSAKSATVAAEEPAYEQLNAYDEDIPF